MLSFSSALFATVLVVGLDATHAVLARVGAAVGPQPQVIVVRELVVHAPEEREHVVGLREGHLPGRRNPARPRDCC